MRIFVDYALLMIISVTRVLTNYVLLGGVAVDWILLHNLGVLVEIAIRMSVGVLHWGW